MYKYLNSYTILRFSQVNDLNIFIISNKTETVVKTLPTLKILWPDVFTAEFYHNFKKHQCQYYSNYTMK